LLPDDERERRVKAFVRSYRWKGPVFAISAVNGEGCRALTFAIQDWLDAHPATVESEEAADDATAVIVTPAPVRTRRRRKEEP